MFRHNYKKSNLRRIDETYNIKSDEVRRLIGEATDAFHEYKQSRWLVYLDDALALYKHCLRNVVTHNTADHAHCLRRYASTLIRAKHIDKYREKTKNILAQSIEIFENIYPDTNLMLIPKIIIAELQRARALLQKVALDLKDGQLLQENIDKLNILIGVLANDLYQIENYRHQYQVYFSSNNLISAKRAIKTIINSYPEFVTTTDYRHLLKIELASILSINNDATREYKINLTFNKFWDIIQKSKKRVCFSNQETRAAAENVLLKELIFILAFDTLIESPEDAFKAVMREEAELLSQENFDNLQYQCRKKTNEFKKTGEMPLSYQLFQNFEPPKITTAGCVVKADPKPTIQCKY